MTSLTVYHATTHCARQANILINKSSRACLADFGLSTVVGVPRRAATNISFFRMASQESLMSFTPGGTVRWMSPELLDPEKFGKPDDRPTKESDCYGLGMVVYEVRGCDHSKHRRGLAESNVNRSSVENIHIGRSLAER